MNIQITKDEKKPLLKKRTLAGKIGYDEKTPARLDVRKELAHKLNAKPELVIIRRVKPKTGSRSADFEADIYEDEKAIKAIEHDYMLERHGLGETSKQELAVPEKQSFSEKKEEKPAEAATENK